MERIDKRERIKKALDLKRLIELKRFIAKQREQANLFLIETMTDDEFISFSKYLATKDPATLDYISSIRPGP